MGLWEIDVGVGIGTGSAPVGAVIVAIVTADNEGGPENPR